MNKTNRSCNGFILAFGLLASAQAFGAPLFKQVTLKVPALVTSSTFPVTDANQYVYDNFILNRASNVSTIKWRGGYQNGTGAVKGFVVTLFAIAFPLTPDTPAAQSGLVARYNVNGVARETPVASAPLGMSLFDYRINLKRALALEPATKYWVSIVAKQDMVAPWGWATARVDPAGQSISGSYSAEIFVKGAASWQKSPNNHSFSLLGQ